MKIEVTQEDIDSSAHNSRECPVALALRRATGRNWRVSPLYILEMDSRHQDTRLFRVRNLEEALLNFIRNYDLNNPVEPFAFDFDPDADPDSDSDHLPCR